MTRKANFTPDEWRDLMHFACIGVSYKYSTRDLHSLNQLVVFIREMISAQEFLKRAKEKYSRQELIAEIINELSAACNSQQDSLTQDIDEFRNLKPLVEKANKVLADRATDEEARAMRAFVYELAFEIANAAGDGFFGMGEKISKTESDFLQELKRHLLDT